MYFFIVAIITNIISLKPVAKMHKVSLLRNGG